MKKFIFILLINFSLLTYSPAKTIIIDHNSINDFEQIPENILQEASIIKLMFRHASVGGTINNGLDCIQGTLKHPSECTKFPAYKYDRKNWIFQPRANSGWIGKIDDFVNEVKKQINDFEIFSFKFCFLDGLDETAEPCGKPFNMTKTEQAWNYLKNSYETLESTYPEKIFIWWTIPLTQTGQYCTEEMNSRIRNYCKNNSKILFDIADIEAYDTLGNHITNNQGWEAAFSGYCGEQKPGAAACHPNWTGKLLLAKSFWVMMSLIAEENLLNVKDINFKNSFLIYPNPIVHNKINIYINYKSNSYIKIDLINSLGILIDKLYSNYFVAGSNTLQYTPKPNLPNGTYWLRMTINNEEIIVKPVMIAR